MRVVFVVALDLLREAASRRWFLALGSALTVLLVGVAFALRLDVVDGVIAATRLFGTALDTDIRPTDVAMAALYRGVAYVVFYCGLAFGIIACADFAPSLLAPGRIEHLLSLPVRRWQLLLGTFIGVVVLAFGGSLYGAGGLAVVLGIKTGVWTAGPILAALIASASFVCLYGAMLTAAVFVRSAALSAALGFVLLVAGIVAGSRRTLALLFEEGWGRSLFETLTIPLPRLSLLAHLGADLASSRPVDSGVLGRHLVALLLFALACVAVGVWRFEGKDY